MSLAGQVQTMALDPITFNNSRVEWALPDDYYLSDTMVIANLGMYATNTTFGNTVAAFYPVTCGVGQCISRFTLYSGSDEIEFLDQVPQWISHQALNNPSTTSEDILPCTLHSGWAWGQLGDQNVIGAAANTAGGLFTLNSARKDYYTTFGGGSLPSTNQSRLGNTQYNGASASLPVKMISGLLSSTPVLPKIPKLRLVIEYDTTVAHYFTPAAGTAPAAVLPTFPLLICQKVLNPPPQPPVVNIPYYVIRCDAGFVVPAIANVAGTTGRVTYQSYAFRSKLLKDLTLYAAPAAATGIMLPQIKSPGQNAEIINFIINGMKYIPDTGIDTGARKMQYLLGTHGNYCIPMMCENFGMFNQGGIAAGSAESTIGNLSLCAIKVDAPITTQIQVEYSRTVPANPTADQYGQFNLYLYGREAQVLSIAAGRASISVAS